MVFCGACGGPLGLYEDVDIIICSFIHPLIHKYIILGSGVSIGDFDTSDEVPVL